MALGHGYPLWSPAPLESSPLPVQQEGVELGDVGIITRQGAFQYLFNVYKARGDGPGSAYRPSLPIPTPRQKFWEIADDVLKSRSYLYDRDPLSHCSY